MVIKKILVPFGDPKTSAVALGSALALARDFGAHVSVLHVRPDPRAAAMAYMGEPVSASMIEGVIRATDKHSAENAAKARKLFDDACAKAKIEVSDKAPKKGSATASFEDVTDYEDQAIRRAGRASDLLVMARPQGVLATPQRLTLEAAMIDTGRPLLMVPPKPPSHIGANAAVAWNGSTQAARAVAMAMDFLAGAQSVVILTAKENGADHHPEDLQNQFAFHGIKAKIASVAAKGDAGKALLAAAAKAGADLLVMGAYSHSRVRQLILGGVTRHVLQSATIPVLMAH